MLDDVLLKERELLKEELQALKSCQMQYFVLTITATCILLSVAGKLGEQPCSELIYLAPLFIVLPCWTVFFDKAATISRIVGYLRVLESLLVGERNCKYVGWETALQDFRRRERDDQKSPWGDCWDMLRHLPCAVLLLADFRRQHRYWAVNWITFFGLGLCALLLAAAYGAGMSWTWWVFAIIFLGATIHNADVLWTLINGRLSYDEREKIWRKVLAITGSDHVGSSDRKQ